MPFQKLKKLIRTGKEQLGLPYFVFIITCWIISGLVLTYHYSQKTEDVYSSEHSSKAAGTTYENLNLTK